MDWNFLFVNSLNGIIYGSFLTLTSLGLSLVFGLGRVVNFAHGVLYALGGYFFIIFLPSLGWAAMVFAPLVVVPLAIAMEWLTIAPIRNRDEIYTLLVTFGLSFMITGAIEYLWGTETTLIKPPVIFQGTVDILGNQFPVYRLFASALSLVVTGLVFVFIQFTSVGLKIRAITDDNEMAEALGINTRWLLTSIFGGAAGFAAFAGALGAPIFSVEPEMGMGIIIDSFLAVILGGLGHLPGTAVGAFIVALAKSIGGGYISEWAIAVLFLVVAAIMVLRPRGVSVVAASPDVEIRVEDASRIRSREIATRVLLAVSALLVLAVPFLNASPFFITLLTEALIFGIWAMSLDLLVGYTGLVSFGHAASFGFATYAAGIFAMNVSADFFLSTFVAIVAAAAVAFFTGLVVTRLSGIAFAILTLCICQVLFQISVVWRSFTGGLDGLIGVPLPTLFGREVEPGKEFYLLTAVTLIVCYLLLRRVVESPFGKTLLAIRANEDRAAAIGIDVRRHKLVILILSWMTGGVAGTLFVFLKAGANPMTLYWIESGNILAITILGGIGTLFGPIIGAIGFIFIRDEVTTLYRAWQFSFGLAFVLAVLFMPSGIAGVAEKIWRRLWPARS